MMRDHPKGMPTFSIYLTHHRAGQSKLHRRAPGKPRSGTRQGPAFLDQCRVPISSEECDKTHEIRSFRVRGTIGRIMRAATGWERSPPCHFFQRNPATWRNYNGQRRNAVARSDPSNSQVLNRSQIGMVLGKKLGYRTRPGSTFAV